MSTKSIIDTSTLVDLMQALEDTGTTSGNFFDMRFPCPYCGKVARAVLLPIESRLRVGHARPACDEFKLHDPDPARVLMDAAKRPPQ